MFSGLEVSREHAARQWTTLASFSLQAVLIAIALVIPLFRPQSLPEAFANRRIFVPMSNGEAPAQATPATNHSSGAIRTNVLVVSTHRLIFGKGQPKENDPGPEPPQIGPGIGRGPDLGPANLTNLTILPPLPAPAHKTRISTVMEGNLLHRVEPQYPLMAREIRLQGAVVLKAVIGREGAIEHVEIVSGPSILARAAFDAVRQWKYKPYYLNNEPIEVETQITVNFILGR